MKNANEDETPLWRRCERAWAAWLRARKWAVVHLTQAVGNTPKSAAPLMEVAEGHVRAPDLQASKAGVSEYWEVKFRNSPTYNELTGEREHWMPRANVLDYFRVCQGTGSRVWIVVYEASARNGGGQWLKIDINGLMATGRSEHRVAADLSEVDAWVWPRSAMEAIVDGPPIELASGEAPVFPDEGAAPPVPLGDMVPIERNTRRSNAAPKAAPLPSDGRLPAEATLQRVMETENGAGLKVLSESIGLPRVPRYSVLRVGDKGIDVSEVLGLLHYGIRLVMITPTREVEFNLEDLQALLDSRLLEWAVVPESKGLDEWIIDGIGYDDLSGEPRRMVAAAESSGAINFKQYAIVHADPRSDIIVHAGAGTGKTETMAERVLFLLCTSELKTGPDGTPAPYDLRLDDIVLVTFTREAARQMRERLAKTLNLRKRLSRRCVMPAVAWMLQLSNAEISTIHSYAKSLARQGGGVLGLSPDFRVSKQTMRFRDELFKALSEPLDALFKNPALPSVPAVHEWKELIEAIWDKLDNNGIEIMPLTPGAEVDIDWPHPAPADPAGLASRAIAGVVEELGQRFADACVENQAIPTSKLVTTALASITAQRDPPVHVPRYVFVDEFQDTDTEQMELMVQIRKRLGANLFVVGDVKQGIYRFRGAEGSAFAELRRRLAAQELPPALAFPLTRNFRSGEALLEALHPMFSLWGEAGLLDYGPADKLEADLAKSAGASSFATEETSRWNYHEKAVQQVRRWLDKAKGTANPVQIAVLCRNNWTAIELQRRLVSEDIPCELVVGGDFYRCPAVRELRVLLEALMNPSDNAALLELCETRWAEGIMTALAPEGTMADDLPAWSAPASGVMSWRQRFSTLKGGSFDFDDLSPLRARVSSLRRLLEKVPLLSLIMLCANHFAPANCRFAEKNDEIERRRYLRCFDHLLMQIDQEFSDTLMTLPQILSWLKIQIATNFNEDEPFEERDLVGKVTALTVHKSKGLEFDHVLVPYTWEPFQRERKKIDVVIDRTESGSPRVIWKWQPKTGPEMRSAPVSDPAWRTEQEQIRMEETRLLYVAMTRARESLVMYLLKDEAPIAPDYPSSSNWGDLVRTAARH